MYCAALRYGVASFPCNPLSLFEIIQVYVAPFRTSTYVFLMITEFYEHRQKPFQTFMHSLIFINDSSSTSRSPLPLLVCREYLEHSLENNCIIKLKNISTVATAAIVLADEWLHKGIQAMLHFELCTKFRQLCVCFVVA